jgi:hypothetical protein
MMGGVAIGWIILSRQLTSEWVFLSFLGALFVALVLGVFTFLIGLALHGKD